LHARADRQRRRARRRAARAELGGDQARHGRQPLPLWRVSENRGGNSNVARLIRTEKELEGRYEEVWLVVDEDALEPWPAGPRDVDEAVRRGSFLSETRVRERGDFDRGLAQADVVVSGEFRTSVVLHNSMETHQAVVQWVGDGVDVYISTQYIWGIRDEVAEG